MKKYYKNNGTQTILHYCTLTGENPYEKLRDLRNLELSCLRRATGIPSQPYPPPAPKTLLQNHLNPETLKKLRLSPAQKKGLNTFLNAETPSRQPMLTATIAEKIAQTLPFNARELLHAKNRHLLWTIRQKTGQPGNPEETSTPKPPPEAAGIENHPAPGNPPQPDSLYETLNKFTPCLPEALQQAGMPYLFTWTAITAWQASKLASVLPLTAETLLDIQDAHLLWKAGNQPPDKSGIQIQNTASLRNFFKLLNQKSNLEDQEIQTKTTLNQLEKQVKITLWHCTATGENPREKLRAIRRWELDHIQKQTGRDNTPALTNDPSPPQQFTTNPTETHKESGNASAFNKLIGYWMQKLGFKGFPHKGNAR
jgi:hypothetical protein